MKALYFLLVGLALFAASPANAQGCTTDSTGRLFCPPPPPPAVTPPRPPPAGCTDNLCGPTGQAPSGGSAGSPGGTGSSPPPTTCTTNLFGALVC
jgi:hypothetical protein